MGWRGFTGEIAVGMLFKKMYCKKCGTRLIVKKNTEIVTKDDEGFTNRGWIGMSSYSSVSYVYLCPNCNSETTYDEQCYIAKIQKVLKTKILKDND